MIHFYYFQKDNKIVISDLARDKIKSNYGLNFEIVNSVRDKESLELIKPRVLKSYPNVTFVEKFFAKRIFSEETKKRMALAKLNKPRANWVREKISNKMKGKSNFEGKKHKRESRMKTSLSMIGIENANRESTYIFNPTTNEERRVKDIVNLPEGFRIGRKYGIGEHLRSGNR